MLVFIKAVIPAHGQSDLFPQTVQVKGHVRGTRFVLPHRSTRRKHIEEAPHQPGPDRGKLQAELKEIEGKIDAAYWRFSRSLSSRVSPPPAELYQRRTEIRQALGLRTDGRLPGDPPAKPVVVRA